VLSLKADADEDEPSDVVATVPGWMARLAALLARYGTDPRLGTPMLQMTVVAVRACPLAGGYVRHWPIPVLGQVA
jgi:hypothetical protein